MIRVENAVYRRRSASQVRSCHASESHGGNTIVRPEPPADLVDGDFRGVRLPRACGAQYG